MPADFAASIVRMVALMVYLAETALIAGLTTT
jgi:hypothetical protein